MYRKLLLFLILLYNTAAAQKPLSQSPRTSVYRYVYRISASEALALYQGDLYNVGKEYLHSRVDSFLVRGAEPPLQQGNYLLLHASGNRLQYELKSVGDLQLKVINNGKDLAVVLHRRGGVLVEDARVSLGRRPLKYDEASKSYRLNTRRKEGTLRVVQDGTAYYYPLERPSHNTLNFNQWFRKASNTFPLMYVTRTIRRWQGNGYRYRYWDYFNRTTANERKFRSFLAYSKPVYKPGDTVRVKAFVLQKTGRGINDKLLLRLTSRDFEVDTILAVIPPYRKGGYSYEFVLNDSLDLDLDKDYLVTLEEERSRRYDVHAYAGNKDEDQYAMQRKVVARGKFKYEEYELESITFAARAIKKEHSRGETLALFLKATDENDLPVMDGRLEITMLARSNSPEQFHAPYVFLPDTIWRHTQLLETVGETKVTVPDSVFPRASFDYEIECVLLNSNNERQTERLNGSFRDEEQKLSFTPRNDSLHIDLLARGVSTPAAASVWTFYTTSDSIRLGTLQLPAAIKVNPYALFYRVGTGTIREDYKLAKSEGKVTAQASRTKDSLFIRLNNPEHLPVWFTVFAGNKPVYRGYADTLALDTRTRTPKNYSLSLQYVYGNKVHNEDYTIAYQEKLLQVAVNAPTAVYPGQRATIEIGVTDAEGKPVAGADLMAYSFTRKFATARPPVIPYLGKRYRGRKTGADFKVEDELVWSGTGRLNWERWSREIGLDSIEYFKFLHPDSLYRNREAARDSITQLAPFVVIGGDLQPIHLLYIDEKPVFFSQSQHLQRYSFRVQPGKHTLRLRIPNWVITLNDFEVLKGVKTIVSINGDTANKRIAVQKAPDTLTRQERALLTRYSILVQNLYGENLSYIEQGNSLYLLGKPTYQNYGNQYLVGPLMPQGADLVVQDRFRQPFDVEAGYSYQIQKGLIKQKEANTSHYIRKNLPKSAPEPSFSDLVLTGDEVDSLWASYLDNRSAAEDLFVHPRTVQKDNGALRIGVAKDGSGRETFVKNIFLFRYDDTDFLRVFRGQARDLGYQAPGLYRLYFLLKDDQYLLRDSIRIQKDGVNFYAINAVDPRPRDSISRKLSGIIQKREGGRRPDGESLDRIRESFNAQFLQSSDFHHTASGQVKDKKEQPLPGVTVSIKGTRFGTSTDVNGFFSLNVPERGTLVFSAVGYQSVEQAIGSSPMDVLLTASTNHLEEVIVVGYGMTRRQHSVASVVISQGLAGSAPGIMIRGTSSLENSKPLVVIDGVPVEGGLESIAASDIASTMVLKQPEAVAIYGSRAANGVIIITTKKAAQSATAGGEGVPVPGNSLRRNFRDDAYWQPRLRTGKDGKARFTTTFPDDITSWRTFAIAVADGKRTGFAEGAIRSFKPVSANLSVPQFAIVGDQVNIIGKTLNYGTDSLQLKRSLAINGQVLKDGAIGVRNSHLDTLSVTVASGDSVHFRLQIQKEDGYYDGEERGIPVFGQGVLETRGVFAALEGDTTFSVQLDPVLGPITLNAEASLLPVLLDEAEKVRRYEHLCNEQLASKLKALITQMRIYRFMKKDFRSERSIGEIVSRLNNSKSGQLWGWWANNEPSAWISLHVVEAMLMAESEGYKTNLPKAGLIDYLFYRMEEYGVGDKILVLNLLKSLDAKVDYKMYVDSLGKRMDSRAGKTSLYQQLRLIELQQKVGAAYSMDSILPKAKHTLFGNLYWGEEGYRFFDNSIQNTILVYRILKGMGGQEATLRKIRNYFLEKRKDGQWRNTYESSLILETILPDLLTPGGAPRPAVLRINGGEEIRSFPYRCELTAGTTVGLHKNGDLPLYVTAYQRLWNPRPQAVADAFTVRTKFERHGDTLALLRAGEPVDLRVEVEVKGDADYVMIEVPIPSGCSYREKPQPRWNNEVHREYFKNKVSIFCSSMKQGRYTFRVPLQPRYTGFYHLNPAKAEMMYFPVFYGREGMKKVTVH
jgi:TonB-dependent SusC/RagA subfamily outer membrane receptor